MNILILCEESQAVCKAFRKRGFRAWSCDIRECSGGHPEWHIMGDALRVLSDRGGQLQDGHRLMLPRGESWDLVVAHPPCTYLARSGMRWLSHPDDRHLPFSERREHPSHPGRRQAMADAAGFFLALTRMDVRHWAIENPIGIMEYEYRRSDQTVQPYWFGDEYQKSTCLWLNGLPPLRPTDMVGHGRMVTDSRGRQHPAWLDDIFRTARTAEERRCLRSKTFPGMAEAMAQQWGDCLLAEWLKNKSLPA